MIAIIAATGSNLTSIENAIKRLGYETCITNERKKIERATHVILPGVGTAARGMDTINQAKLSDVIPRLTCPVLGICLGMQLLFSSLTESDGVDGLGVIPGTIELLPSNNNYPTPHMGWNQLHWQVDSPLAHELTHSNYVYFVHSYAATVSKACIATTSYSREFAAIVQHENFFGMQFHPEKSAATGSTLLKNFCQLNG